MGWDHRSSVCPSTMIHYYGMRTKGILWDGMIDYYGMIDYEWDDTYFTKHLPGVGKCHC